MAKTLRLTEEEFRRLKLRPRPAPDGRSTRNNAGSFPTPFKQSLIVQRFEQQLAARGFPAYVKEYFAIPGREFRWDYAWPAHRLLVEIQGAQHRIKGRFKADIEKRALALIAGWRCLELDRDSITSERSVEWLSVLLDATT